MKQQSTSQPLSPAAVRLFAALDPDQQFITLWSMHAFWEARHPKSRKFRPLELLGTAEQRKAHVDFERRVEQSKRESAKARKA